MAGTLSVSGDKCSGWCGHPFDARSMQPRERRLLLAHLRQPPAVAAPGRGHFVHILLIDPRPKQQLLPWRPEDRIPPGQSGGGDLELKARFLPRSLPALIVRGHIVRAVVSSESDQRPDVGYLDNHPLSPLLIHVSATAG